MTTLKINLGFVAADYTERSPASIPVEVLDIEGASLASTGVSARQERLVDLPAGTQGPVFVCARLPSGERQTKRVELQGETSIEVQLFEDYVSPNEWLAWSRPHIRIEELPTLSVSLREFGNVWTRLWRRREGKWITEPIAPLRFEQAPYAGQFELELGPSGYLLQVGGDHLPWRFVALPGGGLVRVLLTPNASRDSRADGLRVAVSRMKPDEEMLLAYLLRDRLQEAKVLSEAPRLAERLLYGKYDDPISACIGAYFLLRVDRLGRRLQWAENLYHDMPWLADGAVILAGQLLRSGHPPLERIDRLLDEALERGVPTYLEGMRLLNDACQTVASQPARKRHAGARRKVVERLVVAEAWSGPMSGYYGRHPDKPKPERFVGLPGSRKKVDPYKGRVHRRDRPDLIVPEPPPEFTARVESVEEIVTRPVKRREFPEWRDPSVFFVVRS